MELSSLNFEPSVMLVEITLQFWNQLSQSMSASLVIVVEITLVGLYTTRGGGCTFIRSCMINRIMNMVHEDVPVHDLSVNTHSVVDELQIGTI